MPPPGTSATIGPQTIPPGLVAVRELVTRYFWPMAFPSCWSTVVADFCVSRDRPVTFAEFAEHMMWWDDGRFARHPTLKFVFLNVKNKKQALDSSRFFLKKSQDSLPQDSNELLERLGNKDVKLAKDILFFSGTIRGTSQYWHRQHQELFFSSRCTTELLQHGLMRRKSLEAPHHTAPQLYDRCGWKGGGR